MTLYQTKCLYFTERKNSDFSETYIMQRRTLLKNFLFNAGMAEVVQPSYMISKNETSIRLKNITLIAMTKYYWLKPLCDFFQMTNITKYELVPGRYNGFAPVKTVHHQI